MKKNMMSFMNTGHMGCFKDVKRPKEIPDAMKACVKELKLDAIVGKIRSKQKLPGESKKN